MNLSPLKCPACGAGINIDITGRRAIFCPYCATQILIEDNTKTGTKNININKLYSDDAAVERERRLERERKRNDSYRKFMLVVGVLMMVAIGLFWINNKNEDKKAKEAVGNGQIQIGISSSDLRGQKYTAVIKQLDAMGFTDITVVDLEDGGLFGNKPDTVETITIDGDSDFSSKECFRKNAKIVITFH